MKCMFKVLSVALLVGSAAIVADATTSVTPFLSFRSQGQDLARQRVGMVGHEYKYFAEDVDTLWNGAASLTAEYTRSFDGDHITRDLFGCYYLNNCKLNISGAAVADRPATDLAAEWFYLPNNYEGTISFDPVIQNFNADLSLYWGMDKWVKGMFFRVSAPLTWTKWDLGACFKTTVSGTTPQAGVTLLQDSEDFFCSKGVATQTGFTYDPLTCARFCGCNGCDDHTKTRIADVHADLGWNFLLEEDYHLGLFVRAVAPTGNKVKGQWLFEPIVGNGRHWELGGGLTGSAILWRNTEENKHFGFYVDANVTHLFDAHQNRVFDLKNLPLSRYMYAVNGAGNTYAPLANLTSCKMDVHVAVQADVTAMFNYTCHNWSYDLGYNFWVRSCEKFDCDDCDCSCSCDSCSCDSCSTCSNSCCGACVIRDGNTANWTVDSLATIHSFVLPATTDVVLTDSMIDYDGARTKGMSHKVFGHISYNWNDSYENYVPFIGLGGFAEFGINHDCCGDCDSCSNSCGNCSNSCGSCDDDCSCCKFASLSQWGVWLKGGVSF